MFGFITLKPGQNKNVLAAMIDSALQEFNIADGIRGATWGVSMQKDDSSVFIAGWESREVSTLTFSTHAL